MCDAHDNKIARNRLDTSHIKPLTGVHQRGACNFWSWFNCFLIANNNVPPQVGFNLTGVQSIFFCGRRGGLMVSALDSGSNGPGSSPGRGTALYSWARHFTLIVPLSTQVYKWVPANLLLGVTLQWTSIPSRGE